jgi:hypothetical protein
MTLQTIEPQEICGSSFHCCNYKNSSIPQSELYFFRITEAFFIEFQGHYIELIQCCLRILSTST